MGFICWCVSWKAMKKCFPAGLKIIFGQWPDRMTGQRNIILARSCLVSDWSKYWTKMLTNP